MKKFLKDFILDTFVLIVGGVAFAAGLCIFAAPAHILTGGASGLAIVANGLWGLPMGAVIFALICLLRRNRAKAAWLLIALAVALGVGGGFLGLYSLQPSDWAQLLKLAPLALVVVGCGMNIAHRASMRRGHHKKHSSDH